MPPNTVSITRPGKFGNPLRVGMYKDYSAEAAVRDYELWLNRDFSVRSFENAFGLPPTIEEIKKELSGKDLACFCKPGSPCHGDILIKIANQ